MNKPVRFVTSAFDPKGFPKPVSLEGTPVPEFAIMGRSNVGKSSLINHLFGMKDIAKTSAKPGKTCTLNFFCYEEKIFFVDFPGYGFALLPNASKAAFQKMSEEYFKKRTECKLVLFLFDIRRDPTEEDLAVFRYLSEKRKVFGVITKADKIAPTKRAKEKSRIEKAFGAPFSFYSTLDNIGKKELLKPITEALL